VEGALLGCCAFPRGVDVDVLACSLHRPTAYAWHTRGLWYLTGIVLSCHPAVGGGPFVGVQSPRVLIFDIVLIVQVPVRLNQSYRGNYASTLGRVAMSCSDGMDSYSSTYCQVCVGHVAMSRGTRQ
jgi:hypothetical protein